MFGRECWREEKREDVFFFFFLDSFHPSLLKSWCAVRGRKTSKLICYPPFRHFELCVILFILSSLFACLNTQTVPPTSVEILDRPADGRIQSREGEELVLQCLVKNAKPPADIIWFKRNVEVRFGMCYKKKIIIFLFTHLMFGY